MAVKKKATVRAGAVAPYSMLHDIPGAAAVLTFDGEVQAWNGEAAELLGWHVPLRAPRLGSRSSPWLRRLLERVDRSGDGTVIMGHRRGDQRIALELRARNAQQGELLVLLRECTGQLGSRRARREERQKAEENLRRSEEQLRHAQKMDAVGRLTAGIAHDFNNILTAIQGHAQFLIEDLPPAFASREDAVEIKRAAERATELTRQLLTFARRQPTQPVALDINDTVLALEKMLRRLLPTDIRLDIIVEDIAPVFIDPTQFEQIIVNLVVNARDAMPDGGVVTIRTSTFQLDESSKGQDVDLKPGEYVQLTVSDVGRGMSPEVQRHIFEPFFTTKTEGTGLGLPTVYGIVQQARGGVSVYSNAGVGTTFKVLLPVTQRTHRRSEATPAPAGEPARSTG